MNASKTCGNCGCMHRLNDEQGMCRRYPPHSQAFLREARTGIVGTQRSEQIEKFVVPSWPIVRHDEGCWEWKPRIEDKRDDPVEAVQ